MMKSARPFLCLFRTLAVITLATPARGQGGVPLLINCQGALRSPITGGLMEWLDDGTEAGTSPTASSVLKRFYRLRGQP